MVFDAVASEPWMLDGACVRTDPEAFFPEKGDNGQTIKSAKKICNTLCQVRAQCLDFAIIHEERFGVWGGTSQYERRKVYREIRRRQAARRAAEAEAAA